MFLKNFQSSLRFAAGQLSIVLIIACATIAVVLFRQHSNLSSELETRLANSQEIDALHESLADLLLLLHDRVENASALHGRIQQHLGILKPNLQVSSAANDLAVVEQHFGHYLELMKSGSGMTAEDQDLVSAAAIQVIEQQAMPACHVLRQNLRKEMRHAVLVKDRLLSQLAWGLLGIIGTGTMAGALLGFFAQRRLSTSIRKLQIRVLDAAWALKQKMPTIVLTQDGNLDELDEQMQGLIPQIEQVVHDLRQRDAEVVRAKQLAGVGRLAAGVAHELRNPLTAIKILVQLGIEGGESPRISHEDLEIIEAEIRRMEGVLQRFMDLARPQKAEWKAFDFGIIVNHVAGLIRGRAEKQHIKVIVPQFDHPLPLFGDQEQLKQVLINLALNALDAMPKSGILEFKVSAAEETLELRVCDSGPGIDSEIMERLFEPFVSSKETGLGLGLPVSRRIIETHQGTLTAGNRPEGGAEFVVRLPNSYKPSLPTKNNEHHQAFDH